jgi:hypothetical protein
MDVKWFTVTSHSGFSRTSTDLFVLLLLLLLLLTAVGLLDLTKPSGFGSADVGAMKTRFKDIDSASLCAVMCEEKRRVDAISHRLCHSAWKST